MSTAEATATGDKPGTLGTFVGVFTPSILTILGIILFLRLGFVVGNVGLRGTLIIISIASAVAVLTSISLSAIATNLEIRGGGDYYMISRTLGVEFGGAIGVVLFLAQSVSIAFYAVGFGEAVSQAVGVDWAWFPQAVAAAAITALFGLAWMGADAASKFQFGVMVLLVAALASFYLGAMTGFDSGLAPSSPGAPPEGLGFWAIFAIFFPAMTGFTQGVSMSGDLRDPGRSLPIGTFAAVGLSTLVYVSVAFLLAGNLSSAELITDADAMGTVALWRPLIVAGVVAATLSSAMASLLGAPRIMQSLAADRIFPILNRLGQGHGPTNNPRRATVLSLVLALATVALGSLNVIAPVVSMFFLISYGLLNYATYYEARGADPSFRPRFRYFNKQLSLAGAAMCLMIMLAINLVAGTLALLALLAIRFYLEKTDRPERWSDATTAFNFQRAKESISAISSNGKTRSWRPQILAFSAEPARRARLLAFASWLEGGSGLTAVVQIVVGSGAIKRREREEREESVRRQIAELGLDVHSRTVLANDAMEALPVIVQSFGLGAIRANTVLFGWPENDDPGHLAGYIEAVREVQRLGLNVVNMLSDESRWMRIEETDHRNRRIDVYWDGDDASKMALLSAYLFTRTGDWSRARIRLIGRVGDGQRVEQAQRELAQFAFDIRIPVDVLCLVEPDADAIVHLSGDATFVFLPSRLRRVEIVGPFDLSTATLISQLPASASLLAGEKFVLVTSPETEDHQALLLAEERLDSAEQRHRSLANQLSKLQEALDDLVVRAHDPSHPATDDDVAAAQLRVENVTRRLAKAHANLDSAKTELGQLTS